MRKCGILLAASVMMLTGCEAVNTSFTALSAVETQTSYSFFEDWEYSDYVDPLTSKEHFDGNFFPNTATKAVKSYEYHLIYNGTIIDGRYSEYDEHGLKLFEAESRSKKAKTLESYVYSYPDEYTIHCTITDAKGNIIGKRIYDTHYRLRMDEIYAPDKSKAGEYVLSERETYDSKGNLLTRYTPANNIRISFEYDSNGNITLISANGSTVDLKSEEDPSYSLLEAKDGYGNLVYRKYTEYNTNGYITYNEVFDNISNGSAAKALHSSEIFEYDSRSNVVMHETTSITGETNKEINRYNDLNQQIEVAQYRLNSEGQYILDTKSSYSYDSLGNATEISFENTEYGINATNTYSYTYDFDGDILVKCEYADGELVSETEYTYYVD